MKVAIIGRAKGLSAEHAEVLIKIGKFCAFKGWYVVSGNATCSDFAGQTGANTVNPSQVIVFYLGPLTIVFNC